MLYIRRDLGLQLASGNIFFCVGEQVGRGLVTQCSTYLYFVVLSQIALEIVYKKVSFKNFIIRKKLLILEEIKRWIILLILR